MKRLLVGVIAIPFLPLLVLGLLCYIFGGLTLDVWRRL